MKKKVHALKILPEYLNNIKTGKKKAEIRHNDRDYQVGDVLEFREYDCEDGTWIIYHYSVTHIHVGLGLKENYVVLSIEGERSWRHQKD